MPQLLVSVKKSQFCTFDSHNLLKLHASYHLNAYSVFLSALNSFSLFHRFQLRSTVLRDTLNLFITYWVLRPASSNFMASTRSSPCSTNGLPPFLPLALAAARPALDLSRIMLRSSSAMADMS